MALSDMPYRPRPNMRAHQLRTPVQFPVRFIEDPNRGGPRSGYVSIRRVWRPFSARETGSVSVRCIISAIVDAPMCIHLPELHLSLLSRRWVRYGRETLSTSAASREVSSAWVGMQKYQCAAGREAPSSFARPT